MRSGNLNTLQTYIKNHIGENNQERVRTFYDKFQFREQSFDTFRRDKLMSSLGSN